MGVSGRNRVGWEGGTRPGAENSSLPGHHRCGHAPDDRTELLEAIRRELPTLPVIVMTAHGTLETWRRATSQGAFAYLSKPLDATRLKRLLAWAFAGGHEDGKE